MNSAFCRATEFLRCYSSVYAWTVFRRMNSIFWAASVLPCGKPSMLQCCREERIKHQEPCFLLRIVFLRCYSVACGKSAWPSFAKQLSSERAECLAGWACAWYKCVACATHYGSGSASCTDNFFKVISKRSKGGIIRTTRDDSGASRDW